MNTIYFSVATIHFSDHSACDHRLLDGKFECESGSIFHLHVSSRSRLARLGLVRLMCRLIKLMQTKSSWLVFSISKLMIQTKINYNFNFNFNK